MAEQLPQVVLRTPSPTLFRNTRAPTIGIRVAFSCLNYPK